MGNDKIQDSARDILKDNPRSKRNKHPLHEFFWKGVMVFLVVAACITFGVFVIRINEVLSGILFLINVLEPILFGLCFAYILNPIMNRFEKLIIKGFEKKGRTTKKTKSIARIGGILISICITVIVIAILLYMVIPELFDSISNMVRDLPEQFKSLTAWVTNSQLNEKTDGSLEEFVEVLGDYAVNWAKNDLLTVMNGFVATVTTSVFEIIGIVGNIFVGIIVSIYLLSNKEKLIGQTKKILYSILNERMANATMQLVRESHQIFIGFIVGKVIDSCIIGVLCFIGLSLLRMPYTMIVSVIVGVTNIIPFFGPYIGAIVGGILILLASPKMGIVFLVFVLILQQLDGNYIGPKILGESTGLSAFWVIFAIMVGSGLFGFLGMILRTCNKSIMETLPQ